MRCRCVVYVHFSLGHKRKRAHTQNNNNNKMKNHTQFNLLPLVAASTAIYATTNYFDHFIESTPTRQKKHRTHLTSLKSCTFIHVRSKDFCFILFRPIVPLVCCCFFRFKLQTLYTLGLAHTLFHGFIKSQQTLGLCIIFFPQVLRFLLS